MPQNNLFFQGQRAGSTALTPSQLDVEGNTQSVQAHGNSYNAAFNKRLFFGANQAGVTTSAALATTYTGLCLSNPAASIANLSVRRVSGALIVAPAALTAYGLIVGWSAAGIITHTTPLTSLQPEFIGNTTVPQALVDAACTLVGTPAWNAFFAITPSTTGVVGFNMDINGEIVIPPGGYMAIGSTIAGSSSGLLASISWEEIPLAG